MCVYVCGVYNLANRGLQCDGILLKMNSPSADTGSVAIIFLVISKLLACVIQFFWQQKIQTKSKQQFHEK